jgi:hypothetical protein
MESQVKIKRRGRGLVLLPVAKKPQLLPRGTVHRIRFLLRNCGLLVFGYPTGNLG